MSLVVTSDPKNPRIAIIRTSDSIQFKACRRKWNWSSHLRNNLEPITHAAPLWLGSAFHFALEDFHGANVYRSPARSIQAYCVAFEKKYPKKVPQEWMELAQLGIEMAEYYSVWLSNRDPLATYMVDGVPQIEVNIKIPIPMEQLKAYHRIKERYDEVYYSLQLDRVIQDDQGQLWILEYKTAKNMQTHHFATDPQCSRYVWAADCVYPEPVAGVIYQQHRKQLPKPARILLNGTISTAVQATSRVVYRQALIDMYGEIEKVPAANITYLNKLAQEENEDYDAFIRRDRLYRNANTSAAEAQKILLETSDMLDPELSIYPNPTRDCPNFCPFLSPCISLDDGSDYQNTLDLLFNTRAAAYDEWRTELPDPATFKGLRFEPMKLGENNDGDTTS